jgi:hypothetical protein
MWFVVKSVRTVREGYRISVGDSIRLGRVEYRVMELVHGSGSAASNKLESISSKTIGDGGLGAGNVRNAA